MGRRGGRGKESLGLRNHPRWKHPTRSRCAPVTCVTCASSVAVVVLCGSAQTTCHLCYWTLAVVRRTAGGLLVVPQTLQLWRCWRLVGRWAEGALPLLHLSTRAPAPAAAVGVSSLFAGPARSGCCTVARCWAHHPDPVVSAAPASARENAHSPAQTRTMVQGAQKTVLRLHSVSDSALAAWIAAADLLPVGEHTGDIPAGHMVDAEGRQELGPWRCEV